MTDVQTVAKRLHEHCRYSTADTVEQAHMLGPAGVQMFTLTLTPEDAARTKSTGLVVCHSFFELKMLQSAELTLLRRATQFGFAGVYIQAPGMGDSEGSFLDCTVERRIDAVLKAADFLQREVPEVKRICFFGARFGGAVALLAAGRHPHAGSVALWDPALDGNEYWKQTRRFARVVAALGRKQVDDPDVQLEQDDTAMAIGYEVSTDVRADLASIDQVRAQDRVEGPGLLVGLNDALVLSSQRVVQRLVTELQTVSLGLPKPRHLIHLRIGDAKDATSATLDWMQRRLH